MNHILYVDYLQYLYKSVTTLKNREDDIRRSRQANKARSEELKKGTSCCQNSSAHVYESLPTLVKSC